jgi:LmbE family N-acetylglucosaminyl deacetylase
VQGTDLVSVCATLGELDELNKDSWLKHDPANPDVTTNVRLQVLQNERSRELRNIMEEATCAL